MLKCGSFKLLKILPIEIGNNPLILSIIPLIVLFADSIGCVIFSFIESKVDFTFAANPEKLKNVLIAETTVLTFVLIASNFC